MKEKMVQERIRSKNECKKLQTRPIEVKEMEVNSEEIQEISLCKLINEARTFFVIQAKTKNDSVEITKFMQLALLCNKLEPLTDANGFIRDAFCIGRSLGREEAFNSYPDKHAGRKLCADPLYWGEKLHIYYQQAREEGDNDHEARIWVYKQIKKAWKKEYSGKLEENPIPSTDTFLKYWDMYLEQNPTK